MDWPNFFRGIFYSFLPKQCWGRWRPASTVDFARSALVSGLLECTVTAYLLIVRYFHFLLIRTHQMQAASAANEGTQLYFLAVLSFEYVLHPLTMMGLFFVGEGVVRAWSAFSINEVIPTLPLRLVLLLQSWRAKRGREAGLGPELPDHVERSAGELRIACQRPKENWRPSISVVVEDEFYEITGVENVDGMRPILYTLQKLQPGKVIRGAYRYDPPSPTEP